ncbi:YCF48-related protein [Gayadomonas joobiniege]|uniref:YCF48-related protein n=1 Tax=Gayadomonas joobiniege TaxID=1234606 RepID=UPI0003755F4A|nr:YCF48-related protein [Gayadomonas joobiniege]
MVSVKSLLFILLTSVLGAAQAKNLLALDLIYSQSNEWLAVADRGVVLKGDKPPFKSIHTPSDLMLTAITQKPNGEVWAVGHASRILMSTDQGEQWHQVFAGEESSIPLLDVEFINNEIGFAIGAYGAFYRTKDGGNHWHKSYHPGLLPQADKDYLAEIRAESEQDYLAELKFMLPHLNQIKVKDQRLYIVGELGLVAYSDNSGDSWQRIELDYQGSFYDLTFVGDDLYVAGMRGHIYRLPSAKIKADETVTYQALNLPEPININKLLALDANTLLIAGNSQTLWQLNTTNKVFSPFYQTSSQTQVSIAKMPNDATQASAESSKACVRIAGENGMSEVGCAQ